MNKRNMTLDPEAEEEKKSQSDQPDNPFQAVQVDAEIHAITNRNNSSSSSSDFGNNADLIELLDREMEQPMTEFLYEEEEEEEEE